MVRCSTMSVFDVETDGARLVQHLGDRVELVGVILYGFCVHRGQRSTSDVDVLCFHKGKMRAEFRLP